MQGRLPEHEVVASPSCERLGNNDSLVPELGACSFWRVCQQGRSSLITNPFYSMIFLIITLEKENLTFS